MIKQANIFIIGLYWLCLLLPIQSQACGPYGPVQYLTSEDSIILGTPEANFEEMLDTHFSRLGDLPKEWHFKQPGGKLQDAIPRPDPDSKEVKLYEQGAEFYHGNKYDEAREQWETLLEMPETERKHRSVWAAYMLGKMAFKEKRADDAAHYFHTCRKLAADGFYDSESLAADSLGQEALLYYEDDPLRALSYYVKQYRLREPTAFGSIVWTTRAILQSDAKTYALAVRDDDARYIISSYILSGRAGRDQSTLRLWLQTLTDFSKTNIGLDEGAIAWMAYQLGDFDTAREWCKRFPYGTYSKWIRAKLHLRDGEIKEAAELLSPLFQPTHLRTYMWYQGALTPDYRIPGELGTLLTQLEDYTEALNVFLYAGHVHDAAYLAERILSIDELKAFVDANWEFREEDDDTLPEYFYRDHHDKYRSHDVQRIVQTRFIRSLLARRLVRAERWDEATAYFPSDQRKYYTAYLERVRRGYDLELSTETRANAFWEAACIMLHKGRTLMAFDMNTIGREYTDNYFVERESYKPSALVHVLKSETERFDQHRSPYDDSGWERVNSNYRYRAADLAWWACSLMPNNDEETARRLLTAGWWVAHHDAKAGERFYQALYLRCPDTELGKAAKKKNWLPREFEDNTDELIKKLIQPAGKLSSTATDSPRVELRLLP